MENNRSFLSVVLSKDSTQSGKWRVTAVSCLFFSVKTVYRQQNGEWRQTSLCFSQCEDLHNQANGDWPPFPVYCSQCRQYMDCLEQCDCCFTPAVLPTDLCTDNKMQSNRSFMSTALGEDSAHTATCIMTLASNLLFFLQIACRKPNAGHRNCSQ